LQVTHAETTQLAKEEAALLEAVQQAGKQVVIFPHLYDFPCCLPMLLSE
jgi:hypothetical protein